MTPFIPGADYSAPGLAARVLAFLDALGVDRFHLVGNSLGGFVSATLARSAPSRLASLTLICAAGVTAPTPSRVDAMRASGDNPFLIERPEQFDAFYALTMARPPFVPGFVRASIAAHYIARRDRLAEIHDGYFHRWLLDDALGEITVPTLVLWGRQDQLIDVSSTEVWMAGLPDARLKIYDDLGHMPMLEDPARVADDIGAFIAAQEAPERPSAA